MSPELEDRLATVERELASLKRLVSSRLVRNWDSTFGMFAEDPEFDEILRRGSEIRSREREQCSE